MKKIFLFLLPVLIIFQLSARGVEIFESDKDNSSEIIEGNIQSMLIQFSVDKIPEWDYKVETIEPEKEKNFSFMGNERTLVYDKTETSPYRFEAFDYYIDKNTSESFAFINGSNRFSSYCRMSMPETEDELKTEKDLLAIAKKAAIKYVDIAEYTCDVACPITGFNHLKNEYYHMYFISFYRTLENLIADEGICIGIDEYGVIISINIFNENRYDNCFIPDYDKEAAEKELVKKATEECGITENQIAETRIEFQRCRISSERKLMLVYEIFLTLKSENGVSLPIEWAKLAITIDANCYK